MELLKKIENNLIGAVGEFKVDFLLKKFTDKHKFTVRDLLLVRNSKSTQIDNILFTHKKIYCIETKNYAGWIYGTETANSWTQTFNNYGKLTKNSFYNPLTQNSGHIKSLSSFLDLPFNVFENIVVFSNECKLKNITTAKPYNHVVNRSDLVNLIESIEKASNDSFDWEDLDRLREATSKVNKRGFIENANHVARVKKYQGSKNGK
jgi:hypothetical protein